MCGRYTSNTEDEIDEINRILTGLSMHITEDMLVNQLNNMNMFGREIYPSDTAPVITLGGRFVLSKWGFDKWDGSGIIINARSETAGKSRFFSPYAKNGRCIIPASHYFEWMKRPRLSSVKYKFDIGTSYGIFMAGLLKFDTDNRFVILTKEAEESVSFIHKRMPVLIDKTQLLPWLEGTLDINTLHKLNTKNLSYEEAV